MATQAERTAATRGRILAAARTLFITVGYEETTTTMILAGSGVSRGAMYYHFVSKESIFEELYVETGRQVMERAQGAGSAGTDPLVDQCVAWLTEASRPDAAAILLELGPAVLGWRRCRELDSEHRLALGALAAEAVDRDGSSGELTAAMLRAAIREAALVLAHNDDQSPNADQVTEAVAALVRGLYGLPKP